ncbi:TRAP transporter small permease [Dehalobacter sp. DCM]|uniref:TRAP transporter small permease n=1 Tax=Dehalobacter sp. DCM TaxID=2907827 RepID=UPI00308187AB|nr:TRAP transporter small permease [Dehalobacter sp. DCM]
MKKLTGLVTNASAFLDKIAGLCIMFVMLLIVGNIIMRVVFNHPILGTYELVGFFTALGICFALGYCALQDSHIAVDYFVRRFPQRVQSTINMVINGVSIVFWAAVAWYLGKFAYAMKIKGLVSPSVEIPVYPFIYLVAAGMVGLCIVLLYKFLVSLLQVVGREQVSKEARKQVKQPISQQGSK